ncbi:MAG: UDP-N-acetylmuramate--L-alanine ligase [Planctomycetales bacterium]|nr:UDP-N-acetylmuramate--L-alanine ligase [bacterium]UNM07844.1 MAG: UDP-N-acetylmuramate--L-alanine ligase [Planctomycetales bacterium]
MLKRSTKRIHFIGIGGAGVSALAHLMLDMKYEVTGSDKQSSKVTRALEDAGAQIWYEHDERYVRHADLVVRSTAISDENPEVSYAKQHGVPLLSRIEFMAYLADPKKKRSVVISGSHGKSTTTSMVASIALAAQLDPSFVIGSVLKRGIGSARHGESDLFICEGDESNNSMLSFAPHVAVVTNIDYDHMDFHGSLSNLKSSFVEFLNSPGRDGFSVVCLDDENVRSIMPMLKGRVITYGTHPEAEYQAVRRRVHNGGLSFEVHHRSEGPLGVVNLGFPGDHNMQNALCSLAVCRSLGVTTDTCSYGLETFPGIHRRYDMLHAGNVHVIDDYAHHPTEIQNLLGSVREVFKGRLRVIFQPHRYTRSRALAQQFPPAFINADEIILAPIYTANEKPMAGIGLDYLNRFFQSKYDEMKLRCIDDLDAIYQYVVDSSRPGDVVLTVGAGTVNTIGYRLAETFARRDAELVSGVDLERIAQEMSEASFLMDDQN